ncbi:MAG: efflux RND transporter periplasmic adaptor subunit [Ignavibacteriaceae bacterium]
METNKPDLSDLKINRSEERYDSSMARKKQFKFLFYIILLFLIAFSGYFAIISYLDKSIEVKTISVSLSYPSESNAVLTASGYVVAQRKASVASKGTGRLVYLGVVEGDVVKKNQIIARLEDSDIKAQLEQAKANLKLTQADLYEAERYLERQKGLLKSGYTSEEMLEAAESRYLRVVANIELANAGVRAAEVALENMIIRAPFDGTVLSKNADVGEIVAPLSASTTSKAAVVMIADMSSLQLEADVSESNIQRISPNQNCEIILDAYPNKRYPGYIAKIVPTADRSKATVLVKVGFRDYDYRVLPEMRAKVLFLSEVKNYVKEEKPILLVPSTSILEVGNKKVVYVVAEGIALETIITTGRIFDQDIEVISGLSDGERIIEKLDERIKDGIKVKE